MSGEPERVPRGSNAPDGWPLWLLAFALGAAATLAVHVIATGGGALEAADAPAHLARFLMIFAPFALLALIGARSFLAWGAAILFTIVFWGGFAWIASGMGP